MENDNDQQKSIHLSKEESLGYVSYIPVIPMIVYLSSGTH
jgi:hypothetical protein